MKERFEVYKTHNLKRITPEEFEESIRSRLGVVEGYDEKQRDLSLRFHWGHNHDFGTFALEGKMGDRHISLLEDFIDLFPISLDDFNKGHIFDIGCWTGGTTLLLATLGKVCAIEEVEMYAEAASFLVESFDVDAEVWAGSIYSVNLYDQFDIVYFPGVIYHLSDPLVALRILFNSLKVGGFILVESAGIDSKEPVCMFGGKNWNWFVPSMSALNSMMKEVGFDEIRVKWRGNRLYGFGKKLSQKSMCMAGVNIKEG